jgi:hypothetical protein
MPAATMPRFLLVLLVVLPHRLPSGVAVPVAAPSREGAAAAAGPGACPSALQAACGSGSTDTILACDVCTGRHQRELRAALCAPSDIEWWCASRVVQNATQRLSAASSALIGAAAPPTASGAASPRTARAAKAYREANLISERRTTSIAYDAVRHQLFTGNTCARSSSYDDCAPGSGIIQKWDAASQSVVANLSEHNASVTALAYDGTRQLLFSASDEAEKGECCGAVLVWNTVATPPTLLHTLQSSHDEGYDSCDARADGAPRVSIAALHHDVGRSLLFASCGNTIQQWDYAHMQEGTPPVQKRTLMSGAAKARTTPFLGHLFIRMLIGLPRQARDEDKEALAEEREVFLFRRRRR